jgi:excisionase family DNA binding protein
MPILLTPQEVAKILKLNLLTVYDYIRTHKLQAVKLGRKYRIEEEVLLHFIQNHEIN